MSYETWKKIHYATPASVFKVRKKYKPDSLEAQLAAAKHALVKWEGLTPGVLCEHNLRLNWKELINATTGKVRLGIDSDSCSLCVLNTAGSGPVDPNCSTCAISLYRKGESCLYEYKQILSTIDGGDVRPMIQLLRRTVAYLERKLKATSVSNVGTSRPDTSSEGEAA